MSKLSRIFHKAAGDFGALKSRAKSERKTIKTEKRIKKIKRARAFDNASDMVPGARAARSEARDVKRNVLAEVREEKRKLRRNKK